VWREPRLSSAPHEHAILRRERFQFDNVFAGTNSIKRLSDLVKDRVQRAVVANRSLVFMCLSCGETALDCSANLEPPLNILYGSKGGSGVIIAAVSTLMSALNLKVTQNASRKTAISSATVTMTAVIILANNKEKVIDLLCDSRGFCHLSRRADGKYSVSNATVVQLESILDAERIIGVLLGRKSCRKDMQALKSEVAEFYPGGNDSFAPHEHLEMTEEATILLTVHVSPLAIGKLAPMDFHFLCPYGDLWPTPGLDICLLSESLSSYPHTPPPSVVKSSILSQLLLNPLYPSDFLLVANISNSVNSEYSNGCVKSTAPVFSSAASLHSFRASTSLRSRPLLTSISADDEQVDVVKSALQCLRVLSQIPSSSFS